MGKKKEAKRNAEKLELLNSKLETNWRMQQDTEKEIGMMVGNIIRMKSELKRLMKEQDKLQGEMRKINLPVMKACR